MILRNYYNILARAFVGKYQDKTYDSATGDGSLTLMDMSGTKRGLYMYSSGYTDSFYEAGIGYNGSFVFGTGNTPETFDDYKLDSDSGLTISNTTLGPKTYNADTKTWSIIKWCNITNNTDSDVTISEVGIYGTYSYDNGNNYTTNILLFREVLTEPFTIAAGQTVTYNHKIEFQMPQ